ncbi:MAG TPA: N-acetylmuramic acid 6-phosphate etherase [Bryobacteraceae bacterium]|nr:N-acetylmuramic acid 6-phosphate etherase [Bryobacteraceae bacterium]
MLEHLITEVRNPASSNIDTLPTEEALRIINDEDARVPASVRAAIPQIAKAVDAVAGALGAGGRLFYFGAGTSGRLGVLDASECPPTYSVPPHLVQGVIAGGEPALTRAVEGVEDDPTAGAADARDRGIGAADVVCGIAASGRTPYVLGALEEARRAGATTLGVSCAPDSPLSRAVDIAIEVPVGPEVVTGSTRMKAGTATKLVLNMLTTGVMIRMGFVYGNLMVNVQPRNEKLRDRARRIIREVTGVDEAAAASLLESGGNDVRVAILMSLRKTDRDDAAHRLATAGGSLARALAEN